MIKLLQSENHFIIRLTGEIKQNLSTRFEEIAGFIKQQNEMSMNVYIDLLEAVHIDSTILGLLARLAIHRNQVSNQKPVVISINSEINHVMDCMGFDSIFHIISRDCEIDFYKNKIERPIQLKDNYNKTQRNREQLKANIIKAHKSLMSMNYKNYITFNILVNQLENDCVMD